MTSQQCQREQSDTGSALHRGRVCTGSALLRRDCRFAQIIVSLAAGTCPRPERKNHVLVPTDDAALRASVLDPVFLGIQRQFSQERAGLSHSVPYRRRPRPGPPHARRPGLHRAPFLPLPPPRRIPRPLRHSRGAAAASIFPARPPPHVNASLLPP